jgi:hypothetical protein
MLLYTTIFPRQSNADPSKLQLFTPNVAIATM